MSDDRFAAYAMGVMCVALAVASLAVSAQRDAWRARAMAAEANAATIERTLCATHNSKLRSSADTLRVMRRDRTCARYLP